MSRLEAIAKLADEVAPGMVETGVKLLEDTGVAKRIGTVMNPYLEKYASLPFIKDLQARYPSGHWRGLGSLGNEAIKSSLWRQFSYSVPNEQALSEIASHGPVLEIGAGKGYWASLLRDRGTKVAAFDKFPVEGGRNEYTDATGQAFTKVEKGSVEMVRKFPDHNLMLVWPPPNEPMALNALNQFKGKTVFYVGEWRADYIGDAAFHDRLEDRFHLKKQIDLPSFPGYDDALNVYERK